MSKMTRKGAASATQGNTGIGFGRRITVQPKKTKKEEEEEKYDAMDVDDFKGTPLDFNVAAGEAPYRLQHDEEMYTKENLAARKALKKSPVIRKETNKMWMLLSKQEVGIVI